MLTIEAVVRTARSLPTLARVGLGVLAFGGLADLVAHLGAPATTAGHSADQLSAHLIVFVGMVLVMAGVVVDGVRISRTRRPAGRSSKGVA